VNAAAYVDLIRNEIQMFREAAIQRYFYTLDSLVSAAKREINYLEDTLSLWACSLFNDSVFSTEVLFLMINSLPFNISKSVVLC